MAHFSSSVEAKKAGNFSRRHRDNQACMAHQDAWFGKIEDRKIQAQVRQELADERSPQEQVARLDDMFGAGLGATKERGKLAKRLVTKKPVPKEPKADDAKETSKGPGGKPRGKRRRRKSGE